MAEKLKEYVTHASILKRILAFVADLLIINLVIVEPFRRIVADEIPTGGFMDIYNAVASNEILVSKLYSASIFIGIMALFYFALFEWKLNQTIGKMLFGLYVVPVSQPNKESKGSVKIGFMQAVLRNMYLIPLFPFFLLMFIDPIYMFFNKAGQRLSERMSATFVVEKVVVIN